MPGKTRLTAKQLGNEAEAQALLFLQKQGLTLIRKNFTCRMGEIDLIMSDSDQLVFIEVRLRNNAFFGNGLCSVTAGKQKKIIITARVFLAKNPLYADSPCRFDVISMHQSSPPEWVEDAFTTDS